MNFFNSSTKVTHQVETLMIRKMFCVYLIFELSNGLIDIEHLILCMVDFYV